MQVEYGSMEVESSTHQSSTKYGLSWRRVVAGVMILVLVCGAVAISDSNKTVGARMFLRSTKDDNANCAKPSKCKFPFMYRGQTYHQCTSANHNQPWCSYDATYKGGWMNCNNIPANQCADKGVDCLRPKKCTFPFTYHGQAYHQCTSVNHNQPWCSYDAAYSGKWMNCNGIASDQCQGESKAICSPAKLCKFPFQYRGQTFHGCTKHNHNRLWCSIDSVYEGRWVNCEDKWCNECKVPLFEIGEQAEDEDMPVLGD